MIRTLFVILAAILCASRYSSAISAFEPVQAAPAQKESATQPQNIESVNAAVVAARVATKEKRYADSEALMLKVTAARPELIIPRIELGLAQLGLKKYPEAQASFESALGVDAASQERVHSADFYQQSDSAGKVAPTATRTSRNTVGGVVDSGKTRSPELLGTGYASLGEIYIHEGKTEAAQAAFDTAVKANPTQAALYLGNETIFFFQAGNADAQLTAAEKAITADPSRAQPYCFKGQALASKATIDGATQKMILPPGCAEAYRKCLQLEPNGQFAPDAKSVLAAAGLPAATGKK